MQRQKLNYTYFKNFLYILECKDGINTQTCEQRKELCGKDKDFTNGCKKTCGVCETGKSSYKWVKERKTF